MVDFVRTHLLLILTIAGAVVSFLVSFISLVSKQKPVSILAMLAVVGFVVGMTYQLYKYSQDQEKARRAEAEAQIHEAAQKARDGIIQEIQLNVGATKVTVEAIASRLESVSLAEVGTLLVTVTTDGQVEFEETMAFAKGSPVMWTRYADWLAATDASKTAPCLSLTLNAGHHYDGGLLLAYLLTSEVTRNALVVVVDDYQQWHTFSAEPLFLGNFNSQSVHLRYVLFYDGATSELVAFADAESFAQQLMVLHRLGKHQDIDRLLNERQDEPVTVLRKTFPSVQSAVFPVSSPAELVRVMIERQIPLAVATLGPKPYLARLERMIRLAAGG